MNEDTRGSSAGRSQGLIGPGILVLVLAVVGYLIYEPPLKTARPFAPSPVGGRPHSYPVLSAVYGRMWEDPFAHIGQAGAKQEASRSPLDEAIHWITPGESHEDGVARFFDTVVAAAHSELHCMPVLLPGGPYERDAEERRQTRYAVLTTLASCGYTLSYPRRMSFLELNIDYYHRIPGENKPTRIVVPVKLFNRNQEEKEPILVLWVNQDDLGDRPLHVLSQILSKLFWNTLKWTTLKVVSGVVTDGLSAQGRPWGSIATILAAKSIRVSIIGPFGSDTLRTMLAENDTAGDRGSEYAFKRFWKPTLYSQRATVSWDAPEWRKVERRGSHDVWVSGKSTRWTEGWKNWKKHSGCLSNIGVRLVRTIGDDNQLVSLLLRELWLRGAWPWEQLPEEYQVADDAEAESDHCGLQNAPEEHIVLVTEHDTLYGQALPDCFRKQMGCWGGTNLHVFKYLRGIDGKRPDDTKGTSGSKEKGTAPEESKGTPEPGSDESPHGRAQLDYLRRLEEQLLHLEVDLREEEAGRITAIGVVGTDVYDKLLVLRALRKRFPRALFFTTDLEATLADPKETEHTRNLLVASHFALTLHQQLHGNLQDNLQGPGAPFRSSYQTATAFACLLALSDPRVTEKFTGDDQVGPDDPWGRLSLKDEPPAGHLKPLMFEIGRRGPYQLTIFDEGKDEDCLSREIHPHGPREQKWLSAPGWWGASRTHWLLFGVVCIAGCAAFYFPGVRWLGRIVFFPVLVLAATAAWLGGRVSRKAVWWPAWSAGAAVGVAACVGFFLVDTSWFHRVLVVLLVAGILVFAWVGWHRKDPEFPSQILFGTDPQVPAWPVLLGAALVLVTVGLLALIWIDHGRPDGEPFSLIHGVSIWPSTLIRYAAVLFGIYFLCKGYAEISEDRHNMGRDYLGIPENRLPLLKEEFSWDWEHLEANVLFLHQEDWPKPDSDLAQNNRFVAVYEDYVDKGRPGYSWLRVGLLALLYSLFGLSLFWLTDFPATAYRGGFSKWAAVVSLFLAVPLTVAVIAFVLDATFLCRRFVRFLIREYDDRTNNDPWPKAATRRLKEDRGKDYPRDLIRAILLVRLIAHHTKRVARLVYAPFVLVLLLAAARYPGLDYFVFPWTLVLLIGFSLAVLVYNAVALRGQAERAREHLLRRLTDVRPRAALPSSGDRQEQYRLAMSEIQQEQGGAFRPWIQDPIVKAFLIPLGGVGGLALIEQIFPLLP